MSAAQPTWYDILGVARDATPEQIKAAWRAATDKFEPGAGSQFRLFNEAADTLLDPEARRQYDATLTPPEPPQPAEPPEPAEPPKAVETPVPDARVATSRPGLLVSGLVVATAMALLACLIGLGLLLERSHDAHVGLGTGIVNGDSQARADAAAEASATAQRALAVVLSYNYTRMKADEAAALRFLTPAYGKEFSTTFDKLLTDAAPGQPGNAVKTQTIVKASVLQVGVMNPAAATTTKVQVLAFVNQVAQKGSRTPTIFQNRVAVDMVRQGDAWLIAGLTSY